MTCRVLCIGLLYVTAACGLGGCGAGVFREAVPGERVHMAVLPGYPSTVRTWGDKTSTEFQEACFGTMIEQHRMRAMQNPEVAKAPLALLAISGGGEDGAFGAGLLNGWTERGDRPEFMLVTGISTGALTAPMAYLGPPYDQRLKDAYTTVSAKDIFSLRPFLSLFKSDSVADVTALEKLLEKFIDEEMLDRVAAEHAKGRRLLVGTTNLDAQRPVIWDMGAIASSGRPDRLKLFRQVMRASASIPVMFPPVYIEVEIDGEKYKEMHVDGGTTMQVFLFGSGVDMPAARHERAEGGNRPVEVYVIRNARIAPDYTDVRPRLGSIATRSIATLIQAQGKGDMLRIYYYCQALSMRFKLAWIPETFDLQAKEPFEREYMNALYKVGLELGRQGYPWIEEPPGTLTRWREALKRLPPATMPTTAPTTQP